MNNNDAEEEKYKKKMKQTWIFSPLNFGGPSKYNILSRHIRDMSCIMHKKKSSRDKIILVWKWKSQKHIRVELWKAKSQKQG